LTLGPTAGAFINVIEASAQFNSKPLTGSPITYRLTGTSSKAASLSAASGNRQTGQAGEKLPKQIMIKVIDGSNNGVANHPVTFRVNRGEGHFGTPNVTEILVQSDATGFAKANWYLGPVTKPDSQIVVATSTDGVNNLKNVPFRFVAFANPGPPNAEASFVQAIPSTMLADGVARCQVKVYVRDRYGNGIKGAAVTIEVSGEGVRVTQPSDQCAAHRYFARLHGEGDAARGREADSRRRQRPNRQRQHRFAFAIGGQSRRQVYQRRAGLRSAIQSRAGRRQSARPGFEGAVGFVADPHR
jgi:hypothetical protein